MRGTTKIICLFMLSVFMYFIIETSLFGFITPYFFGYFSRPMWFTSFLIIFYILLCFRILQKKFNHLTLTKEEELSMILLLPIIIMSGCRSLFAVTGILAVSYYSIPGVTALSIVIFYNKNSRPPSFLARILIIIILLAPFYYTTARNDWASTYGDVTPAQTKTTIQEGFGTGIKTNQYFYDLYTWILKTSETYSQKDDYIISYVISPMVHMITKRLPALEESFIIMDPSTTAFFHNAIDKMILYNRQPKIAFLFEATPALLPIPLKKNNYSWVPNSKHEYTWNPKQFEFSLSKDPISLYIKKHMSLIETFKLPGKGIVQCFVDKDL